MTSATDLAAVLRRIADLAAQAQAEPDLTPGLKRILSDIGEFAANCPTDDTPDPSDLPNTENQSL